MSQAWRIFGALLPVALVLGGIVLIGSLALARAGRQEHTDFLRRFGWLCLSVSIAGLCLLTLWPIQGGRSAANFTPLKSSIALVKDSVDLSVAVRNLAGNLILFLPIGASLALIQWRRPSYSRATLTGLAIALVVESLQYMLPLGRVVDVDDILLNVIGSVLGYVAVEAALRVVRAGRIGVGRAGLVHPSTAER